LAKLIAASKQYALPLTLGQLMAFGDGSNWIHVPVTTHKNVALFIADKCTAFQAAALFCRIVVAPF